MDLKSNVVKSKSSNSAIMPKSERQDKKTRSNAEFQPSVLKKRGVYVEKKPDKFNIDSTETNNLPKKLIRPPPRPKPGHKKFVKSVLTILSKSTTGTQYPDETDNFQKTEKQKTKIKKKDILGTGSNKTKPKYRSKVLNTEANTNIDHEKLVILQSMKDIFQTSSIFSETESAKASTLKISKDSSSLANEFARNSTQELVKQVFEGKRLKVEKKVRIDEPTTLVENVCIINNKEDKIYNFFIDLLETTFSGHEMKGKNKGRNVPSPLSSKMDLEIDESVAKKLIMNEDTLELTDPSKRFCIKDNDNWDDDRLLDYFQNRTSSVKMNKNLQQRLPMKSKREPFRHELRSQSYNYPKRTRPKLKSESFGAQQTLPKRTNKKMLINLFKEQLTMDMNTYEEPENLFQALKAIARNKRKCQKTIHFDIAAKQDFKDCSLKRRKFITKPMKLIKKDHNSNNFKLKSSFSNKRSDVGDKIKNKKKLNVYMNNSESYQSLKVYDMDYENQTPNNDVIYSKSSFPVVSENNFTIHDAMLKFADSDVSRNFKSDVFGSDF